MDRARMILKYYPAHRLADRSHLTRLGEVARQKLRETVLGSPNFTTAINSLLLWIQSWFLEAF